jgi:hypothetical protein
MEENLMKIKRSIVNPYKVLLTIIAILTIAGVLFIKPEVGVADQGDFDRIMRISGLTLLDSDKNNADFIRFYDYIVPEYKINEIDKISDTVRGSSLSYLIVFINEICKNFGQNIFKTQYLAVIYSVMYVVAFTVILKSINIKDNIKLIIIPILIILIFFDGNYLIWFNSLYGEPMMIVTFALFIASVLNYIHYKYVIKRNGSMLMRIISILLAAYLFIGSKLQVSVSLPFIVIIIVKIIWENRNCLNRISTAALCICVYAMILYPAGISRNSNNLSKDTEYNSVFYGILNGSKTPKQDLAELGLDSDLYVEAGKHSYLDTDEYVKYVPGTEITDEEFYSKISNLKLVEFYLIHPVRLLKGTEYTAGKAFTTSTTLGKCSQSYRENPVIEFHRFTFWSYFRERIIPKNLYSIGIIYFIIMLVSIHKYIKNKLDLELRSKIFLLWIAMLIGAVQFPMPFVGNGRADTAKQLFLFNFIFDGLLLMVLRYILLKILKVIKGWSIFY